MKAPRFRYFNPDRPDDGPSIPGTGQFWKWEMIFWQHAQRHGAARRAEAFWNGRERGSYLDKLESEPEEDRAMVLWMVLQCGRWDPYDDFDVKAYFAKSKNLPRETTGTAPVETAALTQQRER